MSTQVVVIGPDGEPVFDRFGAVDLFSRIRVSNPSTLFDSKQLIDKLPFFWDEVIAGSGATSVHSSTHAETVMSVTTPTEFVIRQTFQRFNYQPGKTQLILCTGVLGSGTGVQTRIGLVDGNFTTPFNVKNGLFFEKNTLGVLSVNMVKDSTITSIPQELFNLDKCNGTGISGYNIDPAQSQIFIMAFEWLGVGSVLFGVMINARIIPLHIFHNANKNPKVYMSYPNLPLRYEIRSITGSGVMSHICSSVQSEGGQNALGISYAVDNGVTTINLNTDNIFNLIAIRLKATHYTHIVSIIKTAIIALTTKDVRCGVIWNPSFSVSPTWTGLVNTGIEFTKGGEISGGTLISSRYITGEAISDADIYEALKLGFSIAGTPDVISVFAQRVTTAETMLGGVTVKELL